MPETQHKQAREEMREAARGSPALECARGAPLTSLHPNSLVAEPRKAGLVPPAAGRRAGRPC